MSRVAPVPAIDVAIVNWNTSQAALAAAGAYLESEGIEARVTIVDNASSQDQRQLLEADRPAGASLQLNDENLGYGAAANRALRAGSAELVCVSNADARPQPRALAELARVAGDELRAGMVGPVFGGEVSRVGRTLAGSVAV